jgi:hypothetical protein
MIYSNPSALEDLANLNNLRKFIQDTCWHIFMANTRDVISIVFDFQGCDADIGLNISIFLLLYEFYCIAINVGTVVTESLHKLIKLTAWNRLLLKLCLQIVTNFQIVSFILPFSLRYSPTPPVILIVIHIYQNPLGSTDKLRISQVFPGMSDVLKYSTKK